VSELAERHGLRLNSTPLAFLGEGSVCGARIVLSLPRTYMNVSGQAVGWLLHRYSVPAERCLIVLDDIDLPVGKVRLRAKGGDGGHKGMRSVLYSLGHENVPRVRIGVGRPPPGVDPAAYVLSEPAPEERGPLRDATATAADAIEHALSAGFEDAMNVFNGPQGEGR